MGRFKDALLLLSLLVVSEAMPHGQSSEETTTGSHESGSNSKTSSKSTGGSSSKSTGGSGSHEYGDGTGLPLNIDQTVVHFEGGPCDFSAASRAVAHPLFCDRFLVCQPGIDDEGQIFNFYVSQLCAPGTVWNDDRRLCTFGTCTNRGGSQARRAVCTASGDPHFRQFDPNCWLHFQGLCTYIMARVNTTKCSGNLTADQQDFEVQAEHTSLGGNFRFGYIKYLHVTYKTKTYRLDPANSGTVTYNDVGYFYTNLALANDNVYFRKRNGELTMFLPNGVSVSVRRSYQGKVRVPPVLQGCMEGFCGNYDGHCGNDLITKAGVQLPYVRSYSNQVGNSWKTDPTCADTTNPSLPECDDELPEYHAVCRTALTRSSTSVFDKCDVDPINIDTCQADICPHVNNETAVQEVICETIRRAMKVECDAMDLKPDNLPEYCKHCRSNPCKNQATCLEGVDTFTCMCAPGYQGKTCDEDNDDCTPNLCRNGATCVDGVNSYTCTCLPGFTGTNCETNIDDCRPDPCRNRATCVDGVNSYTCTCLPGFTGTNCETNIHDCRPDPCRNGAICVDGVNSYTCRCLPGFTGTNCETNIDDCSPNPCNLGRCSDGVNRYWCECPAGYTGRNCEDDIIDCYPDRCQNGGTCNDLVNDYTCNCPPGYTGDNCETDIIDCYPDRCQNGGTCNDLVNDYTCNCPPGYTGDNCETEVTTCNLDCENGGECGLIGDQPACICIDSFIGDRCQYDCSGSHSGPEFDACPCLGCDYGEGASLNAIGYVADPDNCAAFYQCHRSADNTITATWRICAKPLVWSQDLLACAWLWQSADPTCGAFYPTEVSSTTTTTEITPTGKPTTCLGGDAVIYQIHPFLCSKYQLIICTSGTFVDLSCPNGLVFDGTKWVCDWPANVVNQPKQCVDVNCGHPCLEDGVMTCHRYPDVQQANCPFSFYAETKDVQETSAGAVCNGISSYIKVDNMVNREVGNELRLEANFTCEGTNPIQPLVVNSDCQHDATFYVLLRATTGGYLVEMHVVGIKGEATHNSTTVLTVETRYSIVFSYDSVYKTMTLQVNGIITDEIPNIDLGVVMTGRAPLFICYFDRDCDNGRKQDYFKGKIHAVRVFNKIV